MYRTCQQKKWLNHKSVGRTHQNLQHELYRHLRHMNDVDGPDAMPYPEESLDKIGYHLLWNYQAFLA